MLQICSHWSPVELRKFGSILHWTFFYFHHEKIEETKNAKKSTGEWLYFCLPACLLNFKSKFPSYDIKISTDVRRVHSRNRITVLSVDQKRIPANPASSLVVIGNVVTNVKDFASIDGTYVDCFTVKKIFCWMKSHLTYPLCRDARRTSIQQGICQTQVCCFLRPPSTVQSPTWMINREVWLRRGSFGHSLSRHQLLYCRLSSTFECFLGTEGHRERARNLMM